MDAFKYDVVIVGAGIAGSALALALDGSNLKVLLVEAGEITPGIPALDDSITGFSPRVSALTLQSQAFLQQLGVWHQVVAMRMQPFTRMKVWDGEGTAGDIEFTAAEIGEHELGAIVENNLLVSCLLQKLEMSSNVKVLDQAKISDLERSLTGYRLKAGDKTIEAALLVGADGANSFIRQQLNFPMRQWSYGHKAIVATIETEKSHQHTAWQVFHHEGPLALLPLCSENGRHYCSIVWSQSIEQADNLQALDDDAFKKALEQASEGCLGKILDISPRFAFPLQQRHAINYIKKSAVLVGDAAHTIHPLAGQGINLGLKDVQVLAEEILRAQKMRLPLGHKQWLSRYQRRRKADNLTMMALMEGFKRLFEQQSGFLGLLRNQGMALVNQLGPLKQQIIKQAVGK